jgi:hypothetical protein
MHLFLRFVNGKYADQFMNAAYTGQLGRADYPKFPKFIMTREELITTIPQGREFNPGGSRVVICAASIVKKHREGYYNDSYAPPQVKELAALSSEERIAILQHFCFFCAQVACECKEVK